MEFHPFAQDYPLMPAHELGRLEEGMRTWGFNPRFPIILYQGMVLDGRNRWLAAHAAGVKPCLVNFQGTEEEARSFVQLANEERRHLAADWLARRRQERVQRVQAMRSAGQSTRAIAEAEGISQKQVRNDLDEQVSTRYSPAGSDQVSPPDSPDSGDPADVPAPAPKQPEIVQGRDGKSYPGGKPSPTPGTPAKAGQPLFDWKAFDAAFGPLYRQVDVFGKLYTCKETPQAEGLRRLMAQFKGDFEKWVAQVSKTKLRVH